MALKGIVIGMEALVALAIAATAFTMLSFRAYTVYDYGFEGLNNSYSAAALGFSEQHLIYDQYYSNISLNGSEAIADGQGYGLYNLHDFSQPGGNGRIVAIGGIVYVMVRK